MITGVQNLRENMILSKGINDKRTGTMLLPKGAQLTEKRIEQLGRFQTQEFEVEKRQRRIEKKVNKKLREQYIKAEEKLLTAFDQVASGEEIDLDDNVEVFFEIAETVANENDIVAQLHMLRRKDDYTFNHSMSVGILAAKLGAWLDYTEEERFALTVAGMYHDIGKMKIDLNILNKKGRLTDEEFKEMKNHSKYSYDIVKNNSSFDERILRAILMHHEKINGTGYPLGIKGKQISDFACIIAVCDIYHALTSTRPYKEKCSPFEAGEELRREMFGKLDSKITSVFLYNISQFYVSNDVVLNDGRIGKIVYVDPIEKRYPVVQVDNEFIDFKEEKKLAILDITV